MARNFSQPSSRTTDDNPHLVIRSNNGTPTIGNLYRELSCDIFCYIITVLTIVFISYDLYRVIVSEIVHASQFDINSFSMSTYNVNTSQKITANWTINFSIAKNPMNISLSYEEIDVLLLYSEVIVMTTEPLPIQQELLNNASLEVKTATLPDAAVVDGRVAEAISHKRVNDTMAFDIKVNARVRAEKWKKFKMRINCPEIKVRFSSNNEAEMLPDDSVRPYCHHKLHGIIWLWF